jgi:hypothetical protein
VRIETNQDLETAITRLASRTPEALATFIASLAFDIGPIGEQVRTFIVGDNPLLDVWARLAATHPSAPDTARLTAAGLQNPL